MTTRRENIKRYIKVIVEQLHRRIQAYSPEEQELLLKFLHPLQSCMEADYNRSSLSQKFQSARKLIINHDTYINLPFCWFAETFLENAEIALQISLFHADQFYDYLLKILKGTNKDGVFHLLQNTFFNLFHIKKIFVSLYHLSKIHTNTYCFFLIFQIL